MDYDARRSLAAVKIKEDVESVRAFVSKFGKAQRAAEETLEMSESGKSLCEAVNANSWLLGLQVPSPMREPVDRPLA